ncbi:MAG: acyltransferase, partial [Roseiarcus sp.]
MLQSEDRPKLSARLTASLDAARAIAACYVVFHHVANDRGWSTGAGWLFRFGQEAVLIFFLLSGFVIFANERTRASRQTGYYLRRFRRIYPSLIAAMVVSTLIAIDNRTIAYTFSWKALLGTLASIQDLSGLKPGVIVGNCSRPGAGFGHATHGIGRPSRVRRIASMARIDLRRAVSTTD